PAPPPSGGGGGGGGSSTPNLGVTLTPSATQVHPGGLVDVTARVTNTGDAGSLQTHLAITLPAGMTLMGPPAYERGSGRTGTQAIDCFLDYIPNGDSTRVVFEVRADASGDQQISATASADRDSNPSDNSASATISVAAPFAPPAATVPTKRVASHTRAGTARADHMTGTAAPDTLYGLGGNDVLLGLGGNDVLYGNTGAATWPGGPGKDRIYGGPGNDVLRARDNRRDVVDCGPGRDTAYVDRLDRVSGCEKIRR